MCQLIFAGFNLSDGSPVTPIMDMFTSTSYSPGNRSHEPTIDPMKKLEDHWMFIYMFPALKLTVVVLILFANGLILTAIGRHKALRRAPYYYIGSLAVADMLVGIQIFFCNVIYRYFFYGHKYCCLVCISTSSLSLKMSATSLVCLTLERFVKINFPLHHSLYLTNSRIKKSIAFLWAFYGILCAAWTVVHNKFKETSTECILVKIATKSQLGFAFSISALEILIITVLNIQLFCFIWRNQRGKKAPARIPTKEKSQRQSYQVVKMMAIVIGVLYLAWVPTILLGVYDTLNKHTEVRGLLYLFMRQLSRTVLYCNSFVNPIIYHCQNNHFRRAFKRILCPRRFSAERTASERSTGTSSRYTRRRATVDTEIESVEC